MLQKDTHAFLVSILYSIGDSGPIPAVLDMRISSVLQQEFCGAGVPLFSGFDQCCPSITRDTINLGSKTEKCRYFGVISITGGGTEFEVQVVF
jgi:hypothetical protein